MVHFEPADEVASLSAARRKSAARGTAAIRPVELEAAPIADERLAPVSYLGDGGPAASSGPAVDSVAGAGAGAGAGVGAGADDGADDGDDTPEGVASRAAVDREHAEGVLRQRLRGRSLSAAEARTILGGTEVAEHEIEEIIERFIELSYIDEGRLADQIVHSHHERKGLGRSGVQAEMRRRGLDQDLILEKLDEMPDDETERAIEIAVKRVGQLGRLDDQTIDRRLNAFLMRKGYSSSIVRVAVKAALASRGGSPSRVRFQ
ncbi:RecX family transcriptional regulator [Cryobacterium sp. TMT2-18-3]|uniref:regulatory protein RecX n=1 Tax=unclassified Cryobacterium TaxID=2649013 RepID=UPI00106BBE7F|nr:MULTISPECIES: regulatory protein RecX [unclassified Cryobacterium]TFC25905.1 RecX family transcriptional regulator [Cryobacterium sp. TMT2-18-2]TFC32460.1 RecX family transcriptional regulator [Cryobacterium sp. TMT2-42-4]TFC65339.1 RecX family transcriptional regulator [Cryobacterium sp. TMT2-18-3]